MNCPQSKSAICPKLPLTGAWGWANTVLLLLFFPYPFSLVNTSYIVMAFSKLCCLWILYIDPAPSFFLCLACSLSCVQVFVAPWTVSPILSHGLNNNLGMLAMICYKSVLVLQIYSEDLCSNVNM